jgi:hypothetical protein
VNMRRLAVLGLAACVFIASYFLLMAALLYANVVVFSPPVRRQPPWFDCWIGYTMFYSPAVAAALLAAWYSRVPPRGASVVLALFLALIIAMVQWTLLQRTGGGSLLIGELAILSVVFFASAFICRCNRQAQECEAALAASERGDEECKG